MSLGEDQLALLQGLIDQSLHIAQPVSACGQCFGTSGLDGCGAVLL